MLFIQLVVVPLAIGGGATGYIWHRHVREMREMMEKTEKSKKRKNDREEE